MIFDWSLKCGMAMPLSIFQEPVLGFDEGSGDAFEASSIVVHFLFLELRFIFGCDAPEDEEEYY